MEKPIIVAKLMNMPKHFGIGFAIAEIGKLMRKPQRTVQQEDRRALGRLNTPMKPAGQVTD